MEDKKDENNIEIDISDKKEEEIYKNNDQEIKNDKQLNFQNNMFKKLGIQNTTKPFIALLHFIFKIIIITMLFN